MNVMIPAKIYTALVVTPPPILLDPMVDGDAGSTAMRVCCTIYVPPPFIPILLDGKLSLANTWQRLWGALTIENLEAHCGAVIDWLRVVLVLSSPNVLSPLITYEPNSLLSGCFILKHLPAVLIHNLPGLDPSIIHATGSLIATNIGYLVSDQRATHIEAEVLKRWIEDRGGVRVNQSCL